ncbi:efflux RND transporter periplasmic adaptor subunit [Serpentinicella alkaliphila]|uniref:RND family efflux transporter MFP subunit n=1 Tax=Serpentinicella alkaliphila TaxID=1734049 RepID=A0A4R2TF41_9FIRM|nr:efflux RND transporter periplasmic adaptor subunit [Serpentinicella alkaliphila]QUH25972.1 efflux RND transporter periplasmic adaptor subunit [Serpentinicella alkaliphila]TCQ02170.1 RND family efflux transporter MFP subunit [Serpentinicella alkaliphila]
MRGKSFLVLSFYIVMCLIITVNINGCSNNDSEEERLTAIEVSEAQRGNITQWVTLTSQLKPVENVMIFAKTPGLNVTNVNFKVGDSVKEGDLLFELDKSILRQQVEHAKLNYDMAKDNYNKQRELLENQQKAMEDIAVLSTNRGLNKFVQGNSTLNVSGVIGNVEASLLAAKAQVDQSKMAYANTLRQLTELDYYSPIDGVISQLNVFENQIALNQQPALVITNTKILKSNIHVSEKLLDEIRINEEVYVDIDNDIRKGIVSLVNTVADPRSNLYLVEVIIDNEDNALKIGYFNKVRFQRAKKENVVVISKDAILFEGKDTYVFIEAEERVFKRRIELGIEQDDNVEIVSGVETGEKVVIKGQQYLKDKMKVQVVRGGNHENI